MTYQYKYDKLGQILVADNNVDNNWDMGVGSENIYDANGNILRMKTGSLTKNYAYYTNTNKVKNTDGAGNDYVYDATGNMSQSVPKNINQISYDKHIQMTKSITMTNNDKMFFTYDGTERRVLKKDKNNNQLYLYDGLNPIIENMNTRQNKEYVYGPTGVIAIKTDGQINWIIKDHLGSTRVVANMDNTVLASMDYAPYGSVIRYSGNSPIGYAFTGQEYDSTTGMWNFKARMYDSELGIFYARDPMGQGASPFAYCGNNPVVMVDRDGQWFFLVPILVGGAANAIMNADKIHSWKDFGIQFGIGAASGALAYASAGGSFTLTTAVSPAVKGAAQAGITKAMYSTAGSFAWNMAYQKTGASNEVRSWGTGGKILDGGLNIIGPAVFEAKIAQSQGYAKGVKAREDIDEKTLKNVDENYNKYLMPGKGRSYGQIDNPSVIREVNIGEQNFYIKETPTPLFGGIMGDHIAVAIPNDINVGDEVLGNWYGIKGVCHEGATALINKAAGTNYLPTQILSNSFNVAFWQSFYGTGVIPFHNVFYGANNYFKGYRWR